MSAHDKYDNVKKEFPHVLKKCLGIVTSACEQLGVSRNWYYEMRKQDPEFQHACDDVNEIVIDFTEGRLYKLIQENNVTAIIFFLKTRGKHRGYVERIEQTGKDGGAIENKITMPDADQAILDRYFQKRLEDMRQNEQTG